MSLEDYERSATVRMRLIELYRQGVELGCDEPGIGGYFRYQEPWDLREEPDEVRREAALAWLRAQMPVMRLIANEFDAKITKMATTHDYGLEIDIHVDGRYAASVKAEVPADLTCMIVPTGEVEVIPAQPERTVEKMERVCPPSIFAGVQNEVAHV